MHLPLIFPEYLSKDPLAARGKGIFFALKEPRKLPPGAKGTAHVRTAALIPKCKLCLANVLKMMKNIKKIRFFCEKVLKNS